MHNFKTDNVSVASTAFIAAIVLEMAFHSPACGLVTMAMSAVFSDANAVQLADLF